MKDYSPIPVEEIYAARERIADAVVRTPLVKLNAEELDAQIYLKLENMQPVRSFKLRGASNAMALTPPEELERGVWTASAGNMAQGVAWYARKLGVPCTVVVPDNAPAVKVAAVERLGGRVVKVPFEVWWEIFTTHKYEGMEGLFVHAFDDRAVMAGNGTIGLEILEDLPDVDAVIIPYGGGGLCCGIASALRTLKPGVRIYASEVETGAPVAASLAAGESVRVPFTPSFVDGISGPNVFPGIWELTKQLVDGAIVVSLKETAAAFRLLVERNSVVAEGAGATALAAALSGKAGGGKVVCVISGGNIDKMKIVKILQGEVP
jgi:threonine dehydratase